MATNNELSYQINLRYPKQGTTCSNEPGSQPAKLIEIQIFVADGQGGKDVFHLVLENGGTGPLPRSIMIASDGSIREETAIEKKLPVTSPLRRSTESRLGDANSIFSEKFKNQDVTINFFRD